MPKYDLAVLGAGIGALAAASLASRINKKTVVVEPGEAVGGALASFQKNGFRFYAGPRLSFGFERGGILHQLNESLGIAHNASLRSPCYQVALPDRRITVYAEQAETLDELRREFPNEIDKIRKFCRDLRKQSIRNSKSRLSAFVSGVRSARPFIRSYGFSPQFTAFLDVQSFYFFGRPVEALSQISLITLCDSAPFTVDGGFKKLADQMIDVLLKNGGELRYRVPTSQIALKKRGLSIAEETLEADAILVNREEPGQRPLICFGLREEVVPVGMLSVVLCVPDYDHPGQFFTLSISGKDEETAAPPGNLSLTAEFPASMQLPLNDRIQQVKRLIPFLDEYLFFVEEHIPMSRTLVLTDDISMKAIRTYGNKTLISRTSVKGLYILHDGLGTPAQSIAAGRDFIEMI